MTALTTNEQESQKEEHGKKDINTTTKSNININTDKIEEGEKNNLADTCNTVTQAVLLFFWFSLPSMIQQHTSSRAE